MWRYLIFNGAWFSLLFLAYFEGTRRVRYFTAAAILAAAFYALHLAGLDPFAWFNYLAFSILTLWGARQFKRWVFARPAALEEERGILAKRLEAETVRTAAKKSETADVARRADEITLLCDKLKQMSQRLDAYEAFTVLAEALARASRYDCVKLVLFGEASEPAAVFRFFASDFDGIDAEFYLNDRAKAAGELFDFDRQLLAGVADAAKPFYDGAESGAMAYPVFIRKRMVAALLVLGVLRDRAPLFSVLAESFVSEIQRVKLYENIQQLAVTDGLTGVAVRRHFLKRFSDEIDRSRRLGMKLSFLLIDVDDFKRCNDRYGHLVGDVVLKEAAETIRRNIREVDLVGRYGGEEFGVFLTETDESGAYFVAERIRRAIDERDFCAYDERLRLTVSIGCATFMDGEEPAAVIDKADAALYKAKRQGKNRVYLDSIE